MGKGKKIGIGVGIAFAGFIALVAIGASLGGTNENITPKNEAQSAEEQGTVSSPRGTQTNPAGMNQTLTIDDISYNLTATRTASRIVFDQADGQFMVVTLEIVNKGQASETINEDQFEVIDSRGRSFESDIASVQLDGDIFLMQLNPDVPVNGRLAFDVPVASDSYLLQISSHKRFGASPIYFDIGRT